MEGDLIGADVAAAALVNQLRNAMGKASPVEAIILASLISDAVDVHSLIGMLLAAKKRGTNDSRPTVDDDFDDDYTASNLMGG